MIQYRAGGITVFQSALYVTTSTVVETPGAILVTDPAWLPDEVADIRSYVEQVQAGRPLYLLFTHSDWDHILGWKAFPQATAIASRAFVDNPDHAAIVEQILNYDGRNYLQRDYDVAYPTIDVVVDTDGQQLQIGDMTLTFYLAPGHTPCGLMTVISPMGVLLAGDYLSDIEFPYIYDSMDRYVDTLHKMDDILGTHAVRLLVPGHGHYASEQAEVIHRQQAGLAYIETVRTHIVNNDERALDAMLQTFPYPRGMKQYHEDNQKLIKRELGLA